MNCSWCQYSLPAAKSTPRPSLDRNSDKNVSDPNLFSFRFPIKILLLTTYFTHITYPYTKRCITHRLKTSLFRFPYGRDLTAHSWLPRLLEQCNINVRTEPIKEFTGTTTTLPLPSARGAGDQTDSQSWTSRCRVGSSWGASVQSSTETSSATCWWNVRECATSVAHLWTETRCTASTTRVHVNTHTMLRVERWATDGLSLWWPLWSHSSGSSKSHVHLSAVGYG